MKGCKTGVMGLTLNLYKKSIPSLMPQLESFSRELNDIISKFSEPVHYPLAWDKKTVLEGLSLFEKEKVNSIILVFLSYSTSLDIIPLFRKADIPILIWNTQKLDRITTSFSSQDVLENHGMHGVQDLASVLVREGIKFSLITGHYKDRKTIGLIKDWCESSYAVSKMRDTKIGRIGGTFPNMGDFAIRPEILKEILGPETMEIEIGKDDIAKFKKYTVKMHEARCYLPSDTVWSSEITEDIKEMVYKSVYFLQELIKEKELSGIAINFQGLSKEIPMPFLAISYLLGEGIGYGGEGDIYSASAVLLGQILSENKASFTEMFTTDYKNSCIFMSHMGEMNIALRRKDEPVRIVLNKMELGNNVPTVVPVFSIISGRYTLFNITGTEDGTLKFIVSLVEVLDRCPLKKINTPHFFIRPPLKVEDFLTEYSMEGGTHHLAIAYGDIRNQLKFFCSIKNIPYVEIK